MASDLFTALDGLWTKAPVPQPAPPLFIMHRFLAHEPDLAIAARYLQKDLWDPKILYRVWQGLLPKARGAPRLSYVAPKKGPAAEALCAVMMRVLGERREVVEQMIELCTLAGREADLFITYGVEQPEVAT